MNEEARRLAAQQAAVWGRLNDALESLARSHGYITLLLLRLVLALGLEPPEAVRSLLQLIPNAKALPGIALPLGRPISEADDVTTTSQTYVDLVKWEVPAQHTGELFEISMATTDYTKTQFRLVLANEEQWTDKGIVSALTQRFGGTRLTETMVVLIQVQSTDGTSITARGTIAGKLIAPSLPLKAEGG